VNWDWEIKAHKDNGKMERAGASLLSFTFLAFPVHFCYSLSPTSKEPVYMRAAQKGLSRLRREIHYFPLPIIPCASSHS